MLLLAIAAGLGSLLFFRAAGTLTPTHDEYWHLPIGLAMWETGRFDQDRINPPLVRLWAAFPLYVSGVRLSLDSAERESDYGDALLNSTGAAALGWYTGGRAMLWPVWLAGALLVGLLLWRDFGPLAGCLAGIWWLTDPNLLAHGGLVTHDLPAAVAFLAVTASLRWLLQQPTSGRACVAGICLGLAQLVKFTALLYVPVILLGLLMCFCVRRDLRMRSQLGLMLLLCGVALLTINLGYLCQGTFTQLGNYPFRSERLLGLQQTCAFLGWLPIPVPRDYLLGLDELFAFMQQPQPVYLLGEWSLTGFRDYYVHGWLYKTPHLLQLGTLTGLVILLLGLRTTPAARRWLGLTLPPVLLLGLTASLSGNQLGFRYVLPIYPFLLLWAAAGWGLLGRELSAPRQTVLLTGVLLISAASWRHHPDHLAYFNEWAGGPREGRFLLVDSNLDWGQGLHALHQELSSREAAVAQAPTELDGLAYFGSFPPSALGFEVPPPPNRFPQPGRYAVSLNFVQGRPHVIRDAEGNWRAVDIDEFGYFRFFEPITPPHLGMAIYHLTEQDVLRYQRAVSGRR